MMSETEGKRSRRRRSIRLHRQSSVPLLPVPTANCEDNECPEGDPPESVNITNMNVSVFSASQLAQDDDKGSFWVEVNEDTRRTRKSRRSNIGFQVIKYASNNDIAESTDAPSTPVLFDGSEGSKTMVGYGQCESPDIEIPRLPCSEEPCDFATPTMYHTLTEPGSLGRSGTKTPSLLSYHGHNASPCVQTPSQEVFDGGFDDAFMLGTPITHHQVDKSCPPSCEDDSEDSLLIGTPDLAKFNKNIRFRCSLDFSELEQTPVKGEDISADVSQDSVHESPIVGFVYDKLSASDLVRRKRAKSRSSNEKTKSDYTWDQTPSFKHGTPRRIIDTSNNTGKQDVREVISSSPAVDSDMTGSSFMSVGHVNVSVRSYRSTSTSSSYTSCVEDVLSQPSTNPSLLNSPAYAPTSNQDVIDSPSTPTPLLEESNHDAKSTPVTLGKQDTLNPECPDTRDPVSPGSITASTDCPGSEHIVSVSETGEDSKSESNTAPDVPEMERTSSYPEPKSKERSITSEVCDLFRNLAKKFSSSGKKRRKTGSLKKVKERGRGRKRDDAGTSSSSADVVRGSDVLPGFADVLPSSAEEAELFSFRKDLSEQPTPEKKPAASVSKQSLDFSPFLAPGQNSIIPDEQAEPQSPVWKLQTSVTSSDVVVCENAASVNSPVLEVTVLQEKCVNIENCETVVNEPAQKRRGRPKRRSLETAVLHQECENFRANEPEQNKEEVEETSALRRSRRSRRSSLEIFRYQSHTPDDVVLEDSPNSDSPEKAVPEVQPKKTRNYRKAAAALEENLEDLYRNKNYKAPGERMWETLFESPDKTKQPELLMSRRKYRRSLAFEVIPPSKMKRRLQRAVSQGWDVTGRKRKLVQMEEVKMKIAALSAEIETDHNMITM
ncbi:uncharacterized protein LOC124279003 [Haliotis rubra]|uniref:uncharacterized protein LOC124279003 n=1 Tax=Haliotis rubra TaxID=36100 RepID=UPI001EE5CC3F|nr:uncharacterized protein LOC124279003 [Haliotis rubra]